VKRRPEHHLPHIATAGAITAVGLILLKYFPMSVWGEDILYDASGHIAIAVFILYVLWLGTRCRRRRPLEHGSEAAAVLTSKLSPVIYQEEENNGRRNHRTHLRRPGRTCVESV
jgi:hypothetical protein